MTFIDSHAHYENKRYDPDREQLLNALPGLGVSHVINVGCNFMDSRMSIKLAQQYRHVFAAVGVHPHDAKTLSEPILSALKTFCSHPKVVAFGEIGLDFFHDFSPRDVQREWFEKQLQAAHEADIPVIIHSRDANQEVFDIIQNSPVRRGVIHSFSGDRALAEKYVAMGFHLGISGVVTYNKTDNLREAVAAVPLERLIMETDAPYLTPVPHRGKRNESPYLTYVAEAIGKIKGVSPEVVCKQTTSNVLALFPKIQ